MPKKFVCPPDDEEDNVSSRQQDLYTAALQGAMDGVQQCLPDVADAVVAAGQFGAYRRNPTYSSAGGWMDKLKNSGRHLATHVGNRALQSVMDQGGVTGLLNDPYAMLHAVKQAAKEGVKSAVPDITNTVLSAAAFDRRRGYALDENGMPDPISYAAGVYRKLNGRNPPPDAYASGSFHKRRPMMQARGQFRGPYNADGFWDTVGNVASKVAPLAPLLLL